MGLLSRFAPFGFQGSAGFGAFGQPTTMQDVPGVVPIVNNPAEGQGQGPAFSLSAPNKPSAPQQQSNGWYEQMFGPRPANMMEGLANLPNNPLFALGTNLWAASANGGDPRVFAEGMQSWNQQQMQRRQLENQERLAKSQEGRDIEQWSWARDERAQTAERRRLALAYIGGRPAFEQAELRMIDPDELGSYLQDQRQYGLQQQQLELQTQEARDNRAYRGASLSLDRQRLEQDRALNSSETLLGRGEAERLNGWMSRLDNWSLVDNDIRALEEVLQRNPAAFDQLLDGDQSVVLARVRDPTMRRDLNTIYSISANLAREELRGQTPVSNIDLLSAIRSNPNTQSGALFARQWLDRAQEDRRNLEGRVQSAIDYRRGGGGAPRSLYEVDPSTGANWYQGQDGYTRYGDETLNTQDAAAPRGARERWSDYQRRISGSGAQGARGGEAAAAAAAELRRRESGAGGAGGFGTAGGRAGAPQLLREPRRHEQTLVREYEAAVRNNQTTRARALEVQMRRNGLIQ